VKTVNDTSADTTSRGHTIENFDFSAKVDNAQGQADLLSFFDAAGSSSSTWTGETVKNLHIHDISITGSNASGSTVNIFHSPCYGEIIENVNTLGTIVQQAGAPGTTLTFTNVTTSAGTLNGTSGANTGFFTANGNTAVNVTNPNVTASSTISYGLKTIGGTPGAKPFEASITPGTGFTVKVAAGDTSVYNYNITN
jgi:hypothetical protein